MADSVDDAQTIEQQRLDAALQARQPEPPKGNDTGICLNDGCEFEVPHGVRWCSKDCMEEYCEERGYA